MVSFIVLVYVTLLLKETGLGGFARIKKAPTLVKKIGHSRPLFLYFRLFYEQLTVNKCSIKVADDWI